MKKLLLLIVIVIIAVGVYVYLNPPVAQAPVSSASSSQQTQTSAAAPAPTSTALPSNVGATEDSNPNAPAGTAAECAKCDVYRGAQKAECLVALNCQ
jgi:hypothetical protein